MANNEQLRWREADMAGLEGVIVTGDDVYLSAAALAKRLGLRVEDVRERMRRQQIPSIPGLINGERLVPLSLLSQRFNRAKRRKRRTKPDDGAHPSSTPTVDHYVSD